MAPQPKKASIPNLLADSGELKPAVESFGHVLTDDDGYTLTRYVGNAPLMYDAARFTFRPLSSVPRAKLVSSKDRFENDQLVMGLCGILAERITEWNLVDHKGQPLPITAESCLLIHPALQQRLINIIIWSIEGGDIDPQKQRTREQVRDIPKLLDDDESGVIEREQKN